jgi:cytidylate kinase
MAAITISRMMGSLGCQIAQVVGQRLGYQVVWREAINQAAIRAGAPEVALAVIDELGLLGLRPDPQAVQAYLDAIAQVMRELADAGHVVIVGRAGQAILRGRPDVYHVRVIAPVDVRVDRLVAGKGLTPAAARAQLEASDRHRTRYLKRSYHIRWDDPDLYDLVVNTANLSPFAAGELIYRAFEQRFSPQTHPAAEASIEFECD